MIATGEKKEEYREIKTYWIRRLSASRKISIDNLKKRMHTTNKTYFDFWKLDFDTITFRNGYGKNAPTMIVECKGIVIGSARPEWSDNWQGQVFIIRLGNVISII